MRLFVLARHAESSTNAEHVLSSDPARPVGLTPRGRRQARRLGEQIANLAVDLVVSSRFLRAQQTAELALRTRRVPVVLDSRLDELQVGVFDGKPIRAYWEWKQSHDPAEPVPSGESLDDTARRYADALRDLASNTQVVTLVVCHEHALRHILAAAGRASVDTELENAVPYLLDDRALDNAVECLDALAPPAANEVAGMAAGGRW
jgi:broad specificity phosphatase PhoE